MISNPENFEQTKRFFKWGDNILYYYKNYYTHIQKKIIYIKIIKTLFFNEIHSKSKVLYIPFIKNNYRFIIFHNIL